MGMNFSSDVKPGLQWPTVLAARLEFTDQQFNCQHRCRRTSPEVLRSSVMNYFFIGVAVPPGTVPSNFRISPFRPTAQP